MEDTEWARAAAELRQAAAWLLEGVTRPAEFAAECAFAASARARATGTLDRPSLYMDLLDASDEWDESTPDEKVALAPQLKALAARVLAEVPAVDAP